MEPVRVTIHSDPTGNTEPFVIVAEAGQPLIDVLSGNELHVPYCSCLNHGADINLDHILSTDDQVDVVTMPANPAAIPALLMKALLTTAVSTIVNLAVNALFRPETPGSAKSLPSASAVYNVGSVQNDSRLNSTIPVGYGQFITTPPLASYPYYYFDNNENYFVGIYCLGIGEYSVDRVFLADTEESELKDGVVEYQVFGPDDHQGKFGRLSWLSQQDDGIAIRENVFTSPQVENFELEIPEGDNGAPYLKTLDVFSKAGQNSFIIYTNSSSLLAEVVNGVTHFEILSGVEAAANTERYPITSVEDFTDSGGYIILNTSGTIEASKVVFTFSVRASFEHYVDDPDGGGTWDARTYYYLKIDGNHSDSIRGLTTGSVISLSGRGRYTVTSAPTYDTSGYKILNLKPHTGSSTSDSGFQTRTITRVGTKHSLRLLGSEVGTDTSNFKAYKDPYEVNRVELDFVMPRGCYAISDSGGMRTVKISYRVVISDADTGFIVYDKTIIGGGWPAGGQKTTSPARWTVPIDLPSGKYKASVYRYRNNYVNGNNPVDELVWTGLRGFVSQEPTNDGEAVQLYSNTTLVAVKIQASNGVSSLATKQVRVQATRKIDKAIVAGNNIRPTKNPMDAYVDVLTASYGAKLPEDYVDRWGSIAEASQVADSHNIQFNGVFENETTIEDALTRIAQVIPANPTPVSGIGSYAVGITRVKHIPYDQFLFTDHNVLEGTIKRTYSFMRENDFDGVRINYRKRSTFAEAYKSAGSAEEYDKYDDITFFGCTQSAWAKEFAKYYWNRLQRHRKTIEFESDMSGFLVGFGDRIRTSFSELDGSLSAKIMVVENTSPLVVRFDDEKIDGDLVKFCRLRRPDGSVTERLSISESTNYQSYSSVNTDSKRYKIDGADFVPIEGETLVSFYRKDPGESWTVTGVAPGSSGMTSTITAVNYSYSIFTMPGMKD